MPIIPTNDAPLLLFTDAPLPVVRAAFRVRNHDGGRTGWLDLETPNGQVTHFNVARGPQDGDELEFAVREVRRILADRRARASVTEDDFFSPLARADALVVVVDRAARVLVQR